MKTTKKERLPRGEGRERLLSAATNLFIKHGFEATSPQAIYAESGVGQGSFYHHFSGKGALANAVLMQLVESEIGKLQDICRQTSNPLERLDLYLQLTRMGTKGCKFGRFVYETSARKQELSEPITDYFDKLLGFLSENIAAAKEQGMIESSASPDALAQVIVSQVQGGYILSRIYQNDDLLMKNLAILRSLIGLPHHS